MAREKAHCLEFWLAFSNLKAARSSAGIKDWLS
jgi:hypothetical protein